MGENNLFSNINERGEIKRSGDRKPLSPEEEIEVTRLNEEARQLQENQESGPDDPAFTEEQEKENARKRLLVRQSLLVKKPEKE